MALGEVIGAEQARELGLINRVVARGDLETAAMEMARRVAALPPNALRQTKAFLRDREALWQVVRAEGEVFRELLFSPEAQAAFMAFMQK
jgi:enoyl-CoA hydratase/carnithine racemase